MCIRDSTNRERLREITDGIEQGIKELFEREKYVRYLSVMSRFHRYSVNNTMLILSLIHISQLNAMLSGGMNHGRDTALSESNNQEATAYEE